MKENKIIEDLLKEYQKDLLNLTDEMVRKNRYEYYWSPSYESIAHNMALIKAKISVCEEIFRRLLK